MQKILVILGSTRPGRNGKKVADWFMKFTGQHKDQDMEFEFVDLLDMQLPLLDESVPAVAGKYEHEHTKRWSEKVAAFDGYILITPEYNHAPSAALKNALDFLYHEWVKKPVAFIGYGGHLGLRAVEHLRLAVIELQMVPVNEQVEVNLFEQLDENGNFFPVEKNEKQAAKLIKSLKWWSEALSAARAKS